MADKTLPWWLLTTPMATSERKVDGEDMIDEKTRKDLAGLLKKVQFYSFTEKSRTPTIKNSSYLFTAVGVDADGDLVVVAQSELVDKLKVCKLNKLIYFDTFGGCNGAEGYFTSMEEAVKAAKEYYRKKLKMNIGMLEDRKKEIDSKINIMKEEAKAWLE